MKKSALVLLLLLLLCMVIVSALVHNDDSSSFFDRKGDHLRSLPPLKDDHRLSFILFESFMHPSGSYANETMILEDNILKAEAISPKHLELIAFLKGEGNDVERVESLVHEYDLLVKDARKYFELAKVSGSNAPENTNVTLEMTKEEYLDLSRKSIMQSNVLMRDIFHELKPYFSGHDIRLLNSNFVAQGNGMLMSSGSFDADVSVFNGKLSYMDFKNDLNLEFEGGNKPNETILSSRQNMFFYDNFTGNVSSSGTGYNLVIFGEDISISSKGTGDVKFIGEGYYQFIDADGEVKRQVWTPRLFEDN